VAIGFSLGFGAMFSKTWRVHVIFLNTNNTKRVITRLQVLGSLLITRYTHAEHELLVTERQTDRQTERQTDVLTDRLADLQADGLADRQTAENETDRLTDERTDRPNRKTLICETVYLVLRFIAEFICHNSLGYHQGSPVVWYGCCSSVD